MNLLTHTANTPQGFTLEQCQYSLDCQSGALHHKHHIATTCRAGRPVSHRGPLWRERIGNLVLFTYFPPALTRRFCSPQSARSVVAISFCSSGPRIAGPNHGAPPAICSRLRAICITWKQRYSENIRCWKTFIIRKTFVGSCLLRLRVCGMLWVKPQATNEQKKEKKVLRGSLAFQVISRTAKAAVVACLALLNAHRN